jgi:hypothetical protein
MKLRELDATFAAQASPDGDTFVEQDSIDGAQGVIFNCPLCQKHSVLCWFNNPRGASVVSDTAAPGPGRWSAAGSGIDDLTLTPSVNLDIHGEKQTSCRWHGFVTAGEAK